MGTIAQLLKYKTEVTIKHPLTGEDLGKLWIRVLGDESIKDAYKYARVASARKRAILRDTDSTDYIDEIASMDGQDAQELHDLVMASKENDFTGEAVVIVNREELPLLEQIAEEPDNPSLEEQEILDKEEKTIEETFLDKVNEFVKTKKDVLEAELKEIPYEELVKRAQIEMMKVLPLQEFVNELRDQKGFRASYTTEACNVKAFDSIEEYKESHPSIKDQIADAYEKLELGPDEIKN